MSQQRATEKDRLINLKGSCGILILSKQADLVITITNAPEAKIKFKGNNVDGYYEYNVIVSPTDTRNPKIEINKRGDIDKIDFVAKTKPDFFTAYIISEVAKPIRMEDQTKANDIITDARLAQVEINSPLHDLQFDCHKELNAEIKSIKKANDHSITITTITFPVQRIIDAKYNIVKHTKKIESIDEKIRQEFVSPKLNNKQRQELSEERDLYADSLDKEQEKFDELCKIAVHAKGTNKLYIDISSASPRKKFCWGIISKEKVIQQSPGAFTIQITARDMNIRGDNFYYGKNGYINNYKEAIKWYRKAAEQGYITAQTNLGNCYFHGHGTNKNINEAIKWYQKAAEQDDMTAQYQLALCYELESQKTKIFDKAIKWYKKAAAQGSTEAKEALIRLTK